MSACQSGAILRGLISLALCLGGPGLNEWDFSLSLSFPSCLTFPARVVQHDVSPSCFALKMFQSLSKPCVRIPLTGTLKSSRRSPPMSQTALSKTPNLAPHQRDSPLTEASSLNCHLPFRCALQLK